MKEETKRVTSRERNQVQTFDTRGSSRSNSVQKRGPVNVRGSMIGGGSNFSSVGGVVSNHHRSLSKSTRQEMNQSM
jgi:hypothetical protein